VQSTHHQAFFLAPLLGIEEEASTSTTRSRVNYAPATIFSSAVAGEKEDFCKGSLSLPIFYFVIFCFTLFLLALFY
jgi:hypothetical protein